MRDSMKVGDLVFFYHSMGTVAEPTGIYGIAKVASHCACRRECLRSQDEHYDARR